MRSLAVGAALAVVLAACRTSPEPRYYTLDMAPSGKAVPAYAIEVMRLRAAEPLARRDIMAKRTATEVEYYALDQWAADPGQLVEEKLQAEFGHRPDASKTIALSGEVLAFEEVDTPEGPTAHIRLDLEFRIGTSDRLADPALKKTYEVTEPVEGAGPSAVVKTLSRGVEQIAAQVVADADKL